MGSFDPYHQWLGIAPRDQPPNHYRLLGIDLFESNPDVIANAADRQARHVRDFQSGEQSAESQRLQNEIAAARLCLLDKQQRAPYDARMRSRVATGQLKIPDGTVLDEYTLLDQLDASDTGQVFKARHRTMGRVVAIKVLSSGAVRSVEYVERFRRKVKALARLSHPNLVTAFDSGEMDGRPYLVMEYVDGDDWATLLRRSAPPSIDRALRTAVQAAAGLGYSHQHGVYHGNVKPSNLLIDRQDTVKIVGLGVARFESDQVLSKSTLDIALTDEGRVIGTVDYMSPEQAQDSSAVDHRTDIYSLGCTLYTLLTGEPVYPVNSPVRTLLAHRDDPVPLASKLRVDVPAPLDELITRMLAKRPEDRPASMEEVAGAMTPLLEA